MSALEVLTTAAEQGPPGPQGVKGDKGDPGTLTVVGGSGDLFYTHTQNTASATWVVVHGLGKNPSVSVVDSAGTAVEGAVQYDSLTQLTISFSVPFGGYAYLN